MPPDPEPDTDKNPIFDPNNPKPMRYFVDQLEEMFQTAAPDMSTEQRQTMKRMLLGALEAVHRQSNPDIEKADKKVELAKLKKEHSFREVMKDAEQAILDQRAGSKKDKSLKLHCETVCAELNELHAKIETDLLQSEILTVRIKKFNTLVALRQKRTEIKTMTMNFKLHLLQQFQEYSTEPLPDELQDELLD